MADTTGTSDLTVPAPSVSGMAPDTAGFASIHVPLGQVTGEEGGLASLTVPTARVSGAGFQSTIGTAIIIVPLVSVSGEEGGLASLTVPLSQITGTGLAGTIGRASITVPTLTVSGMGYVQTIGRASITVPTAQVSGEAAKDTYGTANVSIPMVQVSGNAYAGTLGSASVTIPIPVISGSGYFGTTGTASITVPIAEIVGYVAEAVILVDINGVNESLTGYALVLNLRNHGLTEYDNYNYNSFCHFNGRYLGANSSGIFNLTGRDDNGTKIRAKARTGLQDGNTALRKGIEDAFLGISADDAITARVVTDGYDTFDGSTINPRKDEVVTERVKFGKGIRSRYLGIEVENRAGCDFKLESAELVIVPLTRKL